MEDAMEKELTNSTMLKVTAMYINKRNVIQHDFSY